MSDFWSSSNEHVTNLSIKYFLFWCADGRRCRIIKQRTELTRQQSAKNSRSQIARRSGEVMAGVSSPSQDSTREVVHLSHDNELAVNRTSQSFQYILKNLFVLDLTGNFSYPRWGCTLSHPRCSPHKWARNQLIVLATNQPISPKSADTILKISWLRCVAYELTF